MLWLVADEETYRLYHCDLCCEEAFLPKFYRRQPIDRGDWDHTNRNANNYLEDAWKFCGCEKGFDPWHRLPDYELSRPKHPHSELGECSYCAKRGGVSYSRRMGTNGLKIFYPKYGADKAALLLCRRCTTKFNLLEACERGLRELKRAKAAA